MQQRINKQQKKEETPISQVVAGYLSYWPLFIICLGLALAGAYIYIRYTVPKYEATASILLKDEKKGAEDSRQMESLDIISTKKIIENEVEVLKSVNLIDSIAQQLHLYAPIFQEGKIRIQSAYASCPVVIEARNPDKLRSAEKVPLKFDGKTGKVTFGDNITTGLNEWVNTKWGEIRFIENPSHNYNPGEKPFFFNLMRTKSAAGFLAGAVSVEPVSKTSSVILLKCKDEVPEKAEDILKSLIFFYNKASINEKNNLVRNTIASIEQRLEVVRTSLDSIQKKVKDYRTTHKAVDLGSQSNMYLQSVGSSDAKLSEVSTQLTALNDLRKFVTSNENIGVLPSAAGVVDPTLTQQMTALNNAQLELERMRKTVGEGNPVVQQLKEQISKMKPNIVTNIETQIKNLQLTRNTVAGNSGRYSSMLSGIPEQERQLLEISRDQNIQSGIYSFLLQKREESVLSYTDTNTDSKVVNMPKAGSAPVSPKKNIIYFAAVLLGLMIPVVFVNGREMVNNKVLYRKEIEDMTSVPVIGEIVHNKTRSSLVLEPGKRSFIAEEFRKIRVSLLFLGIDSYHKKILVTSSIPGEGKSFVAANLAVSLAMTGKKVALVDVDLHNPSLGKLFGVTTQEIGVSEYLLGENSLSDILRAVPNHENLSFISSGGLHPTPSELLENGKMQQLISELEEQFDLVVMDTAPVVMVTDAYHLSALSDATLYVVRHKYTPKMLIKRLDENNRINPLKNPAIIFNGIKARGFTKNNYGYGYDYVYGGKQKINKQNKLKS